MDENIKGRQYAKVIVAVIITIMVIQGGRVVYREWYPQYCAKEALKERLIDPFSVQFRGAYNTSGRVYGEYNAKNRMGAYTGWTRFSVSLDGCRATHIDDGAEMKRLDELLYREH